MRCVAIDDEPNALEVIELYTGKVDSLELMAKFTDPIEASEFLEKNTVDLIFLDINMKGLNGFELLETLTHAPKVIFTTAYSEYAVKSYQVDAIDYLVKPIPFSRFLKAVNKLRNPTTSTTSIKTTATNSEEIISIKSGNAIHRVTLDSILYIEADGNYAKVVTASEKIMGLYTMKEIMEKLNDDYLQVHRSFIVNLAKVDKIETHQLKISDQIIPVGVSYRKTVARQFQ